MRLLDAARYIKRAPSLVCAVRHGDARIENEEQVGPQKHEYREDGCNDGGVFPHQVKRTRQRAGVSLCLGIGRRACKRGAVRPRDKAGQFGASSPVGKERAAPSCQAVSSASYPTYPIFLSGFGYSTLMAVWCRIAFDRPVSYSRPPPSRAFASSTGRSTIALGHRDRAPFSKVHLR
jgi:hypothetical protein